RRSGAGWRRAPPTPGRRHRRGRGPRRRLRGVRWLSHSNLPLLVAAPPGRAEPLAGLEDLERQAEVELHCRVGQVEAEETLDLPDAVLERRHVDVELR